MRVRIKLTTLSDKDLLTLNCIPEFNFRGWVRDTLGTYARTGEILKITLPASSPDEPVLKNIMFSINFDKTRDAVVVELLTAAQKRLRSSVIKSILRSSLSRPCLYASFDTYPAPFPVVHPESSGIIEQTNSVMVATLPTAPPTQATGKEPNKINIFEFDDEIN